MSRQTQAHRQAVRQSGRQADGLLFVGCLTSQQHASVSQGRICSDNCTCCHTEIKVADQTFYLTQSQYTGTGPTSHWYDSTRGKKNPHSASGNRSSDLPASERTPLTTRPTRRSGLTEDDVEVSCVCDGLIPSPLRV